MPCNPNRKLNLDLGDLHGPEGNAFAILARFPQAARRAGWTDAEIAEVIAEATSAHYDHLLRTIRRYTVEQGTDRADALDAYVNAQLALETGATMRATAADRATVVETSKMTFSRAGVPRSTVGREFVDTVVTAREDAHDQGARAMSTRSPRLVGFVVRRR